MNLVARFGELARVPQERDEIEIREGSIDGTVLFRGLLDEPAVELIGALQLYQIALKAIGYRTILNGRILTQSEAIQIVKMNTAAQQVASLIALFDDFTQQVTLPSPDTPYHEDMRFDNIGSILDRIALLHNVSVVVTADKHVPFVARQLIPSCLLYTSPSPRD